MEERVGEENAPLWEEVVAAAERPDCESYSTVFVKAAEKVEGDASATLRLLADITGMALVEGARLDPLRPRWTTPEGRTPIPEDLSDEDLDALAELLPSVRDPDLAARICDVLWSRRRDPAHARTAIDSYLAAVELLEDQWSAWLVRVERALAFAAVLQDRDRRERLVVYLKRKLDADQPSRLAASALELLLRLDDHAEQYAKRAEDYALAAASAGNILQEREFYGLAAQWHRKNGSAEAERRCRIAEAETYVAEAERASDADTALFMKAHFFEKAIEAYRRVGKTKDRVTELHQKLLDVQARIPATMKHLEGPKLDLTDAALETMEKLDGCALPEALLRLALMVSSPSVEETRQRAEKLAKENPLSHLFGHHRVNEKGRVVFAARGGDLHMSEESEPALLASMHQQCDQMRGIYAAGVIEPARQKIFRDHAVSESSFMPLVTNNPVVPPGRERLFARALHAGLTGDLVQATHIAIPQVENLVRVLLNARGVITTAVGDDRPQDEHTLGSLLDKPELVDILGEDTVFDLKGLLTERAGSNLRNVVAHGLLPHSHFFSAQALYLWWLTLHLCFRPVLAQMGTENTEEGGYNDDSDESSGV